MTAVSLVAPDLEPRLRTRHLPVGAFDPAATPCFSDIVFAFDASDELIPRPEGFSGWWPSWDDGFGDLITTPDLGSRRRIGWRSDEDLVFADLSHRDGRECRIAPRQVLRRVSSAVTATGPSVRIGTEVEFFLTDADGRDDLATGSSAYAFAPPARDRAVLEEVVTALAASDVVVENWYAEGGPRQYELALAPSDPLTAADTALLSRLAVAEIALARGLRASFRPKPGPGFGSGLHVHLSLGANDSVNLLRGLGTPAAIAEGRAALAGVLAVLHPATAMLSPTPSGYDRLVPHSAAGTSVTWADDNRSAGVRYLDRGDDARIEVRTAASDAHPHLVVAALLAGVMFGLERRPPLGSAGSGDLYAEVSSDVALPGDLPSATAALRVSSVLRRHLGDELIDHYAATRDWAART